MNKFNSVSEYEEEKISNCCSALMNDFNVCLCCKENASPVDEEELIEMQKEEIKRNNEKTN